MTGNKKAEKYKKRAAKEAAFNAEEPPQEQQNFQMMAMGQMLGQAVQLIRDLNDRVARLEDQNRTLYSRSKATDYRSLAVMELLEESNTIQRNGVVDKIVGYNISEFTAASAGEDRKLGLTQADDATAGDGMYAIISVSMMDANGVENVDERILRAKVVIGGEEEIVPGFNAAVAGMRVGEQRAVALESGKTAMIDLIGLRTKAQEQQQG